jgi:excisionase family DNA binding protein
MESKNINILSIKDVAIILKIGKSKAYKLFKIKGFPSFRVGRLLRVLESDFKDWLIKQA